MAPSLTRLAPYFLGQTPQFNVQRPSVRRKTVTVIEYKSKGEVARMKFVDLTGRTINRWTVIGRADPPPRPDPNSYVTKLAWWSVRCDCGTMKVHSRDEIRRVKSCGCLSRERLDAYNRTRNIFANDPELDAALIRFVSLDPPLPWTTIAKKLGVEIQTARARMRILGLSKKVCASGRDAARQLYFQKR